MRFRVCIPIGIFLLGVLFPATSPAIVADRILAVVNREVIALSDVQKYREVFVEKRDADDSSALKELMDQRLLLAEAKKLEILPPSEDEIARAYKKLRLRFGRPETFELLKTRLALTDDEIEEQIKQQLLIHKLIEQRIYFFVFVTPEEIEAYYQEHLGEFKNQTPEAARKVIQDIRTAEKSQQKLKDYLDRLRAKADIRINRPPPE
jgi:peptidyl-prolyl cis-trans isomerase SurA